MVDLAPDFERGVDHDTIEVVGRGLPDVVTIDVLELDEVETRRALVAR